MSEANELGQNLTDIIRTYVIIDMKAFFQVLLSSIPTVYKGHIQMLFSGAVCSTGF